MSQSRKVKKVIRFGDNEFSGMSFYGSGWDGNERKQTSSMMYDMSISDGYKTASFTFSIFNETDRQRALNTIAKCIKFFNSMEKEINEYEFKHYKEKGKEAVTKRATNKSNKGSKVSPKRIVGCTSV